MDRLDVVREERRRREAEEEANRPEVPLRPAKVLCPSPPSSLPPSSPSLPSSLSPAVSLIFFQAFPILGNFKVADLENLEPHTDPVSEGRE